MKTDDLHTHIIQILVNVHIDLYKNKVLLTTKNQFRENILCIY